MSAAPPPVHTGKIKDKDLAAILMSLGFTLDRGEANAQTYELISHHSHGSLTHHFRLLSFIRAIDRVSLGLQKDQAPTHRVMAIVWYGSYYHTGLVIEILGEDIQDHIIQKTGELVKYFEHEVPIAARTLRTRMYEYEIL